MHIQANHEASRLMLAHNRPGQSDQTRRPVAGNIGSNQDVPQTPFAESATEPASEPNTTVSLKELLSNWGNSDSASDLNNDGVVDAADLAMLLGGLGGNEEPEPGPMPSPLTTETAPESAPASPELQIASTAPAPADVIEAAQTTEAPAAALATETSAPAPIDAVFTADAPIAPGAEPPATTDTGPTEPSSEVQQLLREWGQKGSDFDLNGDGTVDAADLAMLLGGEQIAGDDDLQNTINELTAASAKPVEADPALNGVAARVPAAIANAIFKANGHEGADRIALSDLDGPNGMLRALDHDGDGFIERADLENMLARELKSALDRNPDTKIGEFAKRYYQAFTDDSAATQPANAPPALDSQAHQPRPAHINPAKLKHAAEALGSKLSQMGFESKPPLNIADVLDSFKLNNSERRLMLNHLARRFPEGLGVNHVG